MSDNVELIMQTLFDKLVKEIPPNIFASQSRRFKFMDQVEVASRPFFCFLEEGEQYSYESENVPVKLSISPKIFVYINTPNADDVPASQLNKLVKAISDVLKPDPSDQGTQTLDGLVSHCRIEGAVIKVPGDIDGDGNGLAVIPLKILTNI